MENDTYMPDAPDPQTSLVEQWLNSPETSKLCNQILQEKAKQKAHKMSATENARHSDSPRTAGAVMLRSSALSKPTKQPTNSEKPAATAPLVSPSKPTQTLNDEDQLLTIDVNTTPTVSLIEPKSGYLSPTSTLVKYPHKSPPKSPRSPAAGRLKAILSPSARHASVSPNSLSPVSLRNGDLYPKLNGAPLSDSPTMSPLVSPKRRILSPRSHSRSPRCPPLSCSTTSSPTKARKRARRQQPDIPPFYFPNGMPLSPHTEKQEDDVIRNVFEGGANPEKGLTRSEFTEVTRIVVGLSSYCTDAVFSRCCGGNLEETLYVTMSTFKAFWRSQLQRVGKLETRLFKVLCPADRNYLKPDDFCVLLQEVVRRHPGLEFLSSSPNFHGKYIETVICRMFYSINSSDNGRMTLRQVENSNLVEVLASLDDEEDINDVWQYFSYEHFYVIYCKFWELDCDHDFLISANDLAAYHEYGITRSILDRVVEGAGLNYRKEDTAIMSYSEFIYFILAEEDKSMAASVRYWFRLMDIDGDDVLSAYELDFFFKEQGARISNISDEPIEFYDILCQLNDMVRPVKDGQFRRRELIECQNAPLFFNMMFNLTKFAIQEQRDPGLIEARRSTPHMTPWDRFASNEYGRYAADEPDC